MSAIAKFHQLSILYSILERVGTQGKIRTVTFQDLVGNIVGSVMLDGGLVRFGVKLECQVYFDDIFAKEAPAHDAVLRKVFDRIPLAPSESQLLRNVPYLIRRALRSLTARAIQKIASLCDLSKVSVTMGGASEPKGSCVDFNFPPVELMLAGGRAGSIRYNDPVARIYETPPENVEERWLFECQPEDVDCFWPVMTSRLADRRINAVAAFSQLGQRVARYMMMTRLGDKSCKLRAVLLHSDELVYYLISNERYLVLLLYPSAQLGRVVQHMDKLLTKGDKPSDIGEVAGQAAAGDPPSASSSGSLSEAWQSIALTASSAFVSEPVPSGPTSALPTSAAAVELPLSANRSDEATEWLAVIDERPARSPPPPPNSKTQVAAAPLAPAAELDPPAAPAREPAQVATTAPPQASTLSPLPGIVPMSSPAVAPTPAASIAAKPKPPLSAKPLAEAAHKSAAAEAAPVEAPADIPISASSATPAIAAVARAVLASPTPSKEVSPTGGAEIPPRSEAPPSTSAPLSFSDPVLSLRGFTASIEGRTILKDVCLVLGRRGVYGLMGPGGSGKSSLIGILSGRNRGATGWMFLGEALYDGLPLGSAVRPTVVGQRILHPVMSLRRYLLADLEDATAAVFPEEQLRSLLEYIELSSISTRLDETLGTSALKLSDGQWWRLAIGRELLSDPKLLCVDEPTANLEDAEASRILTLLKAEGRKRAVLFVSHNQQHARSCCDYMILLASGQIQECKSTSQFFDEPQSKAARDYVRTGSCYVASPDAPAEHLDAQLSGLSSPPQTADDSRFEELAALPRPEPSLALDGAALADSRASILWQCKRPSLSLRGFGLQLGNQTALSNLSLDIPEKGISLLIMPEGGKKRLLLRTLCKPRSSTVRISGQATYLGRPLEEGNNPATVEAEARLLLLTVADYLTSNMARRTDLLRSELQDRVKQIVTASGFPELFERFAVPMTSVEVLERRVLEILRASVAEPKLLILDEPLAGLPKSERTRLLSFLRQQAEQRALLLFAQDAAPFIDREAGLEVAIGWFSEGRLLDAKPAASFPSAIESAPGPDPEPESPPAVRDPSVATLSPPARIGQGPRGFQWLRPGALAGMPAPGLTNELGYDLELIKQAGITWLITLTIERLPPEPLAQAGIRTLHLPVEDMGAPSCEAAAQLSSQVVELLAEGQVVGFHCKAGLGRTGTMLAALLIWEGNDASTALKQVRAVDPNWIQSDKQVQFLSRYEEWLLKHRPFVPGTRKRNRGVESPLGPMSDPIPIKQGVR